MIKRKRYFTVIAMLIAVLAVILTGCGKDDTEDQKPADTSEEVVVEEKDYLSVQTSISYSAGDDMDWSYGNQRKEFPNDEASYVRIGSTAISDGSFGKGVGDEIIITYRFAGAEYCTIEISDGKVTEVETDDPNVADFTRTVSAEKEKNATESFVIFRYIPDGAESIALEVLYDDQIAEKYDDLNTIYFED